MFTGLVQAKGKVVQVSKGRGRLRLGVRPLAEFIAAAHPGLAAGPPPVRMGDSISISGCCLTVSSIGPPARGQPVWGFDVVGETLDKTTLGRFKVGTVVNLEPAATLATCMGGHLVQGHVDGVGRVVSVVRDSSKAGWGKHRIRLSPPPDLLKYLAPKGSVCIDGVSLTVAELSASGGEGGEGGEGGWFEVALIPTTLELTTLGNLKRNDPVNLEMDIIGKTVIGWLEAREAAIAPVRRPAPIRPPRSKP